MKRFLYLYVESISSKKASRKKIPLKDDQIELTDRRQTE